MKGSRFLALALLAVAPLTLPGQGTIIAGRVLTDSGAMVVGAEVVLNGPANSQRTDSKGEFRFTRVPGGEHVMGVRMPGFAPVIDTIEVADAGEVRRDFILARIEASLPEVDVKAKSLLDRRLAEFHERRGSNIGRFLDSAEFANRRGSRTSDRLASLPGIVIQRGRFLSEAYVTNNRSRSASSGGGSQGQNWCRALVWLDNVNLGTDFSVNQLDPSLIAAVEWYAGEATIPARFAVPQKPSQRYCGVLVLWTR